MVKCHPIITGCLHANEQSFIGETGLFDLGHEKIQSLLAVANQKFLNIRWPASPKRDTSCFRFANPIHKFS